ncbi:MAG: glycosyltransferase family 39 protein [Polyangiaceae bacterium]|nr:glycosyltransferase family 39 protein [Polyangiaceae bacterium]
MSETKQPLNAKSAKDAETDVFSPPIESDEKPVSQEAPAQSDSVRDDRTTNEANEDGEQDGVDLVPRGNPLRKRRGAIAMVAGAVGAFLLMAKNGQNAWGVPVGFFLVAVCTFGVMDFVGSFDDAGDEVTAQTTLSKLTIPLVRTLLFVLAFAGSLALAQSPIVPGWPWWLGSITVTATFVGIVASVFSLGEKFGPWAKDELGQPRPLVRRHGFWVLAIGALLYFPAMGVQSLWDPWETHYGEVAREILSRDDWISLWWAQDGWFWSKPILNFWIQSLAMATLGTHYQADQMLMVGRLPLAHPEWVMRVPNVLMTLGAMYILYKGVAKVFGRRAGLLGAIVLATMPDWYFLAHQTMTDMPFVAAMTAAMGLLLVGLNTEEEARVKLYELEAFGVRLRLSLWHLVFGALLLCVIPQILYLLSRNIELVVFGNGPKGFRIHWDEFQSGSPGNCGLPGNEACTMRAPAVIPKSVGANPAGVWPSLVHYVGGFEPSLQAVLWGVVTGGLLYLNWGERRVRRLVYVAAWLCAAIATMAKGPAGFALPMICAFAYVATKKRWSELLRLEMVSGVLVILAVAIPWYVAMYVRHGPPFLDRLIFHDMLNRAFSHVHDTNEGDDTGIRYYIWQFGYAIFPWVGLAPLALIWGFRRSDSAVSAISAVLKGPARIVAVASGNKSSAAGEATGGTTAVGDASVMLFMWFLFAFALFTFMGTKFHHYIFPAVPPVAMLIGIVLDDVLPRRPAPLRGTVGEMTGEEVNDERTRTHESMMVAAAALVGALVVVLVGRDLFFKPDGSDQPGAIRLLQLFTYNYKRPWPEALDFSKSLKAFTVAGVLVYLTLAVEKIRAIGVRLLCGFALVWAIWGLDVYMVKLSPHWGQHEVIEAYYRNRQSPDEVLVAYQMNWKGENLYTGNRIPAFVSTGAAFQSWLKQQREKGTQVMYFITEHSRLTGLRNEVAAKSLKEITDKKLCNKFVLVRAEL